MTSRFTHFLQRSFYSCQQIQPDPIQQQPSTDFTTELGDLRKFSLNSLMTFLAILATPKAPHPVVFTLLLYTNSLHLSHTCSIYNRLTLSGVFHVIPLLVVSCMACVQLVSAMQSPVLAVVTIFLGVLPLITMAISFGAQLVAIVTENSAPALPVRMH